MLKPGGLFFYVETETETHLHLTQHMADLTPIKDDGPDTTTFDMDELTGAPVVSTQDDRPADEFKPEAPAIPDKFRNKDGSLNQEALLKSYTELEKSRSAPDDHEASDDDEEASEDAPDDAEDDAEKDEEKNKDAPTEETFKPFMEEWSEKGELSEESYEKLGEMGVTKEMVQCYAKGIEAEQQAQLNDIMSVVGGQEAFKDIAEWALEGGLSDDEKADYDAAVSEFESGKMSARAFKAELKALNQKYQDATSTPKTIKGRASRSSSRSFKSLDDVVKAKNDSRYGHGPSSDPAYTQEVEERIRNSTHLYS